MMKRTAASPAAVGIVVKSGWAAAVLVAGAPGEPRVADSRRIELSDPQVPESRQPYHEGFGTARQSGGELTRLVDSVKRYGRRSVTTMLEEFAADHDIAGLGIVVGSLIDPERLANDHIRIHALEGRLFRTVVEGAAQRQDVPCTIWREKDLFATAAAVVGHPEAFVRRRVATFKSGVDGPWRAEQKAAATAGWMVLAARGSIGARTRAAKER